MRILYLGDIVGRAGRKAIIEELPKLRREWRLDFVVVNGENATGGVGISVAHAKKVLAAGVDCLTLGDHAFDQREMSSFIESEPRLLRPINYAQQAPGGGARIYRTASGDKVLVVQVLGQVFMKRPFSDPFSAVDAELRKATLGAVVDAAIVDIHAEATSEKTAMGHFCNGRASLVVGSHTHVPTGDARILSKGTAFMTDAGMTGDYDSVIGFDKEEPLRRFVTGMSKSRFSPALGEATLSGIFVETERNTGKAKQVVPVRWGGSLPQSGPLG